MKPLNKQLWYRALDRAVPETYNTLSGEQLGKAIDAYTELVVRECMEIVEPCKCGCSTDEEDAIADSIITEIKGRFGVEE